MIKPSKAVELIRSYRSLRHPYVGRVCATATGFCFITADMVRTHCCCSGVIVAEPPCSLSFLIRSNASHMTPTNRFNAKKELINIHMIPKRC